MKSVRICLGLIAFVALGIAGVAVASNLTSSRHSDFFSPGKHQFYVWCSGQSDYVATAKGNNAEEARVHQLSHPGDAAFSGGGDTGHRRRWHGAAVL